MLFQPWQNFFLLTGTAAATLAGLLFVGLTFSVGMLGQDATKTVRIWAEPNLSDFAQALVVSAVAVAPGIPAWGFGALLLLVVLIRLLRLAEVVAYLRGMPKPNDLELGDWLDKVVYPVLLGCLALAGGLGLLLGWTWAPLAVAAHVLGLLLLGITNTWEQLVWMTVQKHQRVAAPRSRRGRRN